MHIITEDLWIALPYPGMIVVTTNSTIKQNGALVMGRGAARQARDTIKGVDVECGTLITEYGQHYGFLEVRSPYRENKTGFGIFQVKHLYSDAAELNIISMAVAQLLKYISHNPTVSIRMNYPGIGNGRLSRAQVEPFLKMLPDNVAICIK